MEKVTFHPAFAEAINKTAETQRNVATLNLYCRQKQQSPAAKTGALQKRGKCRWKVKKWLIS